MLKSKVSRGKNIPKITIYKQNKDFSIVEDLQNYKNIKKGGNYA